MRCLLSLTAAALLVLFVLPGCASHAPAEGAESKTALNANAVPADTTGFSAGELRAANLLYSAKCVRCHKSYDPAAYSDAAWHAWMTKMGRKARLKPDEAAALARYLEAFRVPK
jgi:hypothetical protein